MRKLKKKIKLPKYTKGEEIFNAITHGVGLILSVVGFIFLVLASLHNTLALGCSVVYFLTCFALYLISTLYHSLPFEKIKNIFRKLDHSSIFLFIAGSYTPISILLIRGEEGIGILSIIWISAILGFILNMINVNKFAKFSLCLYIALGWISVFLAKTILAHSSVFQIIMLVSGGLSYTIGAGIYGLGKKIKYMHSVWHLFVLSGSVLHFLLIYSLL